MVIFSITALILGAGLAVAYNCKIYLERKVKDPEKYIQAFRNFESVEDPVNVAKALIRPMICAP